MNSTDKLVITFGLLVLAICIIVPTASASEYSQMERMSETMLSDSQHSLGIISPSVSIGPNQVAINYIGASTNTEDIIKNVGSVVGVYWNIVDNYPEVGDLLITIEDADGNAMGTLACQKSWVSGLDLSDTSATQSVALKIMLTAKTTGDAVQT